MLALLASARSLKPRKVLLLAETANPNRAPLCGWTNQGLPEVVPTRGSLSIREPSSTTTQSAGGTDCAATLSSVRRR
jgi:hypothetical protein